MGSVTFKALVTDDYREGKQLHIKLLDDATSPKDDDNSDKESDEDSQSESDYEEVTVNDIPPGKYVLYALGLAPGNWNDILIGQLENHDDTVDLMMELHEIIQKSECDYEDDDEFERVKKKKKKVHGKSLRELFEIARNIDLFRGKFDYFFVIVFPNGEFETYAIVPGSDLQ